MPETLISAYKKAREEKTLEDFFQNAFDTMDACLEAKFGSIAEWMEAELMEAVSATPQYDLAKEGRNDVLMKFYFAFKEHSFRKVMGNNFRKQINYPSDSPQEECYSGLKWGKFKKKYQEIYESKHPRYMSQGDFKGFCQEYLTQHGPLLSNDGKKLSEGNIGEVLLEFIPWLKEYVLMDENALPSEV